MGREDDERRGRGAPWTDERIDEEDGWLDGPDPLEDLRLPVRQVRGGMPAPFVGDPGARQEDQARMVGPGAGEGVVARGKPMAIFSHGSVVFGLPVFVVPFVLRDNGFALHHARAAACSYLMFFLMLVLSIQLSPLFFPLAMLCYIPALVGVYRAARGQEAGRWGLGRLGERIFHRIEVKE